VRGWTAIVSVTDFCQRSGNHYNAQLQTLEWNMWCRTMTSCFYEMINTNHVIGHRELCYVVIGTSQQIRWWKILLQHPLWFQIIQFVHFVFRLQRSSHIATRVNCQKETFTKLQNFSNLFMYIRVFFSARKIGMVRCKYGNLSFIFPAPITVRIQHLFNEITSLYRGADKSLARPGSEQTNVSVRMAWISFGALPFREKKKHDDSSRLDVVEVARVPDMLPSLFPSWPG